MTNIDLEKSLDSLPPEVLPDGTLIRPGFATEWRYWISDDPFPPGAWSRLRARHADSGLWPVFFEGREKNPRRPWLAGEVGKWYPRKWPWGSENCDDTDDYDAETVLSELWAMYTEPMPDFPADFPAEVASVAAMTAPYGRDWPGLAAGLASPVPPDRVADSFANRLINRPGTRLGLVPVERGADIPGFLGWNAADESQEPGGLSAVLRGWEDRFGVRVVRLGYNTLVLSVAAPPASLAQALPIAAEHFAFCRDNFGYSAGSLTEYAQELVGVGHWSFLWDLMLPHEDDEDDDLD